MKDERSFLRRKAFVFVLCAVLALTLACGVFAACAEKHTHTLKHHAAVTPSCAAGGSIEYWECTGCGKLFSDQAAAAEITQEQTVLAATDDHDWGGWRNGGNATCTQDGSRYRTCLVCGEIEEEALAATGHALSATAAKAPTCAADGNIAYWHCSVCGKYFSDAAATAEIARAQTVLKATGEHDWGEWEVTYVNCTDGGVQTRRCNVCGKTEQGDDLPPKGHDLEHHDAVEPTCVDRGMEEYWQCRRCGLYFAAEKAEDEDERALEELIVRATGLHTYGEWITDKEPGCTEAGHRYKQCGVCGDKEEEVLNAPGHEMTHHAEKAPTCTQNGNVEYYFCSRCGLNYRDFAGSTQITGSVEINKTGHEMTHHAANAPTCTQQGNKEYYYCSKCQTNYADGSGSEVIDNVVLEAKAHADKVHHRRVDPTCTQDGNIEYWFCPDCGVNYKDEACTLPAEEIELAAGHILAHVEEAASTCAADGMKEHWKCSRCDLLFSDAAGELQVSEEQLTIPSDPDAHVYVDHKCGVCGEIQAAEEYASLGLKYYTIGDEASLGGIGSCTDEQVIVVPAYNEEGKKVTAITQDAFRNFKGQTIVIPATVRTINGNAFTGCTAEIVFEGQSELREINDGAFKGYAGSRIVLPDGVQRIGQVNGEVFANCGGLTVWIPDSVTFIAPSCFSGNTGMIVVQYEGSSAQYDDIRKDNIYEGVDWDNYQNPESFNVARPVQQIPLPDRLADI